MKTQTIAQRMRVFIENLEKACFVKRNQFGKKSPKSFYIGFDLVETKPVEHSAVYLYDLPLEGEKQPNFGLSFSFYQENSNHLKLPIEEQTVQISYCYDSNVSKKEVFYSEPMCIHDAKIILKEITRKINEKGFTTEYLFHLIEELALNYKEANKEEKITEAKNILQYPLNDIKSSIARSDRAIVDAEKAKEEYNTEVKNSAEYKMVLEAQKALKIAEKNLKIIKDESISKHQVIEKAELSHKLERELEFDGMRFKGETLEVFKKLELSHRHLSLFSDYFEPETSINKK